MEKPTIIEYVQQLKENNLLVAHGLNDKTACKVPGSISYYSGQVTQDCLFICKGNSFKEEYLDSAISNGAFCYVSEKDYKKAIPCILVNDIHKAMSVISGIYYDYPWKHLKLLGITGTKGKSTTSYYLKYILDEYLLDNNKPEAGIISSIDTYDGVIKEESRLTTPEPPDLQRHFRNAVDSGISYMVTEVSSQALKYGRVYGVCFDVGAFLNISEDHISPVEHTDFEDYFQSKLKLFKSCKTACINLESNYASRILEAGRDACKVITFGLRPEADIYGYDIRKEGSDILFKVRTESFDKEFVLTMPGLFNVENALAAISIAYSLNIPYEYMYEGLKKARSSGRMEIFSSADKSLTIIVDYAHNKLSFSKLYESIKEEYKGRKIVTIFGCPGGKAYTRRRDLGLLSGMHSDKIVLTSEDPGEEDVYAICKEISEYVKQHNNNFEIITDRGKAIRKSILHSEPGTIILLTGKGNETREKIGKKYVECPSDIEYVKKYLEEFDRAAMEAAVTTKF